MPVPRPTGASDRTRGEPAAPRASPSGAGRFRLGGAVVRRSGRRAGCTGACRPCSCASRRCGSAGLSAPQSPAVRPGQRPARVRDTVFPGPLPKGTAARPSRPGRWPPEPRHRAARDTAGIRCAAPRTACRPRAHGVPDRSGRPTGRPRPAQPRPPRDAGGCPGCRTRSPGGSARRPCASPGRPRRSGANTRTVVRRSGGAVGREAGHRAAGVRVREAGTAAAVRSVRRVRACR